MSREVGPERAFFGGEDGLYTEICAGKKARHYWKCMFCNWELGGKNFQNSKARIHLSGDPSLRNGLISNVCGSAPDEVKERFRLLEQSKRVETEQRAKKRKRMGELLNKTASPATAARQSRLSIGEPTLTDDKVDDTWGEAFFGLDISISKITQPLFREAIATTKRSKFGFVL